MSALISQLEPHPEVDALLREVLEGARAVLGERFVGAYLFGSLASGDFDEDSDIDLLFVTGEEIPQESLSALQSMHARINARASHWATQLEVSYIPRRALRRRDPGDCLHPHLDRGRGETLRLREHDSDWVVQRHVLRERGLTLAGPDPRTLIEHVSPDDLRRAMHDLLWWPAEILCDPARIGTRGYQSYLVLTMCRVLYTLRHGAVVSKRAAADWAQETLGARRSPLIERAWAGRREPRRAATPEDVNATLDLIRHTLEQARRDEVT